MQSKKEVGTILDQPGKSVPPRNLTLVPPPHRQWTSGICYCCKNRDWGCFAVCCYFCLLNQLTKAMNEKTCYPCLPWCGLVGLRMKMRTTYGIEGDGCKDCCQLCFCNGCVACQMHYEAQQIGIIEKKTCSDACNQCCVCYR
ncbi:unnamed protein product [Schistosoma guineensis]|uniref:Uncharacterized protein n=3 Tax=Schistosoma TaxID=6181 RepID=A0A095AZD2_SCHHA|nr:hypothetical protein MS3_00007437 [Schistosoma haematobium]RTG83750.1 uncharacterized protein DC041_0005498 [Schistosoma bovis]CAH8556892.1 unnamed protein product [Schistosoma mattheei]CAH8565533.1 unnamed protein product [Schistosoma intercalatum]CAH8577370.1 unnamed protein product [Schistosoma guineensis]CAH8581519.1 unnamed protein product [Schistosoma curassoni]